MSETFTPDQRKACPFPKYFWLRVVEKPTYWKAFQAIAGPVPDDLLPLRLAIPGGGEEDDDMELDAPAGAQTVPNM